MFQEIDENKQVKLEKTNEMERYNKKRFRFKREPLS
jgi:hypothetical protein